jgi:uncharacterized protein YyaL (SSP411 family)
LNGFFLNLLLEHEACRSESLWSRYIRGIILGDRQIIRRGRMIMMAENAEAGEGSAGLTEEFRFSPRPNRAHEIDWMPWGKGAFQRADEEGKPVLLSISAVWCHWCHVMDETSYSDASIIDLINDKFVPVRVDSDRNPDINRRYNQGGWPTTAFLNPEGIILAGATYIPPETMRVALERISELYAGSEVEISVPDHASLFPTERTAEPGLQEVKKAGAMILSAWDRAHGGLGSEPKFPQTEALAFALDLYVDEDSRTYLDFTRHALEAMIRGNLLDKVEGGFFRYSTTRDWSIPHYEKMLADNAGLIPVLIHAYGLTGSEIFRRTAAETAAYIQTTLGDGVARFYGSQDADEEYYLLDAEGRKGLTSPPVDRTVYTDLAARASASMLMAGTVLEKDAYSTMALAALDSLWSGSFRTEDGMAHYHDGEAHRWGFLDDSVETAIALMTAHGYTGEEIYLERAETLLRIIVDGHWDEGSSLFLDTSPGQLLPGLKAEPAGLGSQSRAVQAMLHYWALRGEEEWRDRAGKTLTAASGMAPAYGIMAAPYAAALNLYLRGPLLVKITGAEEAAIGTFLRTALLSSHPRMVPMVSRKVGIMEKGIQAEVCTMDACQVLTSQPEVLAEHLEARVGTRRG